MDPPPMPQHRRDLVFHAHPHTSQVEVHHGFPISFRDIGNRRHYRTHHPRAIHRAIKASKLAKSPFHHCYNIGALRHISLKEVSFPAVLLNQPRKTAYPLSRRRAAITTFTPSGANRGTAASPIPDVPPVTSATFP